MDAQLLVVGDGCQRKALIQLSQSLGIGPYSRFPGLVPMDGDLPGLYRLADVFATASEIETQGLDRLIIDVRDNSGGSTDVSAVLLRYLAHEPFRHFASYDLKVSRPIKRQLKRQLPAAVRWRYQKLKFFFAVPPASCYRN